MYIFIYAPLPPKNAILHLANVNSSFKIRFKFHLFRDAFPDFIMQSSVWAQHSEHMSSVTLGKLGSVFSGCGANGLTLGSAQERRS